MSGTAETCITPGGFPGDPGSHPGRVNTHAHGSRSCRGAPAVLTLGQELPVPRGHWAALGAMHGSLPPSRLPWQLRGHLGPREEGHQEAGAHGTLKGREQQP